MPLTLASIVNYGMDNWHDKSRQKDVGIIKRAANESANILARFPWRWFHTRFRIRLRAPASVGVISVANGAATGTIPAAGATWPADAVGMSLTFGDDDLDHEILTSATAPMTGDVTVTFPTIDTYYGTAVVSGPYIIYRWRYALPTNFRKLSKAYHADLFSGLRVVSAEELESARMEGPRVKSVPEICCVTPNAVTAQAWDLAVWPPPSTDSEMLEGYYDRAPAIMTTDASLLDWDDNQRELYWAALLLQLTAQTNKDYQEMLARFKEIVARCRDWKEDGPISLRAPGTLDEEDNEIFGGAFNQIVDLSGV